MEKKTRHIHSSAPLRINDIGGWTDTWFSEKGNVLNMAVSPGAEVDISVFDSRGGMPNRVRVHAVDYDEIFYINPEKPDLTIHPLIQAAVSSRPIPEGQRLDIKIRSFLPAGSAVGTSASVCVALLGALDALSPGKLSVGAIAALAHQVETEKLHMQSGIQDQICAAFGGVCFIHMQKYPDFHISHVSLSKRIREDLNHQLCLIYLGSTHRSSDIHERVIKSLKKGSSQAELLKKLRSLAEEGQFSLISQDLVHFGRVMIDNNELQRILHPDLISEEADAVIKIAKKYCALGWKVNGAGGQGGSLTVLSGPDRVSREGMITAVENLGHGIRHLQVSLSSEGLIIRD